MIARSRCEETYDLLMFRQQSFTRAKERLEQECSHVAAGSAHHRHNTTSPPYHPSTMSSHQYSSSPHPSSNTPLSYNAISSTPLSHSSMSTSTTNISAAMLRRRSYAGNASSPLYSSTAAAFKDKDSHVEEYLFGEGLITSDMSDRVVASLPKGLSMDSRLRSSRESLRGSCENLASDQLLQRCHSTPVPNLLDCSVSIDSSSTSTSGVATQSNSSEEFEQDHLKERVMRRIQSAPTGSCVDSEFCYTREGRLGRTLSMITGSTDSLPR